MKKPLAEWHSTGGKGNGIALADDNTAGAERQGKYAQQRNGYFLAHDNSNAAAADRPLC